jgi:hypothetical protein
MLLAAVTLAGLGPPCTFGRCVCYSTAADRIALLLGYLSRQYWLRLRCLFRWVNIIRQVELSQALFQQVEMFGQKNIKKAHHQSSSVRTLAVGSRRVVMR